MPITIKPQIGIHIYMEAISIHKTELICIKIGKCCLMYKGKLTITFYQDRIRNASSVTLKPKSYSLHLGLISL